MIDTEGDAHKQLTFDSRSALVEWLRTSAPADPIEVARITLKALGDIDRARNSGGGLPHDQVALDLLHRHWSPRFPDVDLGDAIGAAEAELEAEKAARAEERKSRVATAAARRAEQADKEARQRKLKEARAETVKKIAAALNCSTRWAQHILREGVKDPVRAKQLEELLGGHASHYLKPRAKPGRPPDLAKLFLRAPGQGLDFYDFANDDIELAGEAADMVWRMAEPTDEYRDFHDFIAVARERGLSTDTAELLWLSYWRWRIRVIAERAESQIEEKIERLFDFG